MRARMAMILALAIAALAAPVAQAAGPEFRGGGLISETGGHIVAFGGDFSLASLELSGAVDEDFGAGGISRVSFPGFADARSFAGSIQLGARTVLAGYVTVRCHPSRGQVCGRRVALARFLSSGRLDPSFGRGGRVVTGWKGGAAGVLAPGGHILITGRSARGLPTISRLRFDGRPDPGFGRNGQVTLRTLPTGVGLKYGRGERIAVQPNGRILVSVFLNPATGPRRNGLVRLTSDGRLDRSFGEGGFLINPVGQTGLPGYGSVPGHAVDIVNHRFGFASLPSGQILVSVAADDGEVEAHVALLRLRSDGSPDLTYGQGGIGRAPEAVGLRFATTIVTTPSGGAYVGAAGFGHAYMLGFLADGSPSPTLDGDGVAAQFESWGSRASLSVLGDGSIAIADDRRDTGGILVGRYTPGGSLMWTTTLP